jgi:hypothetical protein
MWEWWCGGLRCVEWGRGVCGTKRPGGGLNWLRVIDVKAGLGYVN